MTKEEYIKEVTSNPHRLRENYSRTHYPNYYSEVINFVDFDITFREKLWYYKENITTEHLCKCGSKTTFNKKFEDGYKKACSAKCVQNLDETKIKRENTNIEKYGVTNVAKNEMIKNKIASTNLEKYGSKSSFGNEEVRKKWRGNVREKYGVEHTFQLESVKKKSKQTMDIKYGDYYTRTSEYRDKLKEIDFISIVRKNKLAKHNKFFDDNGYEFLEIRDYKNFKLRKGDDVFEICWDTFINRLNNHHEISTNKNPLSFNGTSKSEEDLNNWIQSLGFNTITSDRKLLSGKEVDIIIEEEKLGIEYNGLYWHQEDKKGSKYHLEKTEAVNELGYDLIHVWEDDWVNKKSIIKSIIKNRLGIINNTIYARKCIIKEVDTKQARLFLDVNHIQGYSNSKYKYGLYFNGELVSLMTFSIIKRNGIERTELTRFCNKIDMRVIGGSSKLFNYFLKCGNNNGNKIISYSDRSMFSGNLYTKLGFSNTGNTQLNYWWVVDKQRKHRFNYRKHILLKEGADPNLTEREIMYSRGCYKIWGCGQKRWEFTP